MLAEKKRFSVENLLHGTWRNVQRFHGRFRIFSPDIGFFQPDVFIGNPKSDFRKPEPTLLLFDEGQSEMMPQISCPRFSYNQKCSAKMDGCSILAEPRF